VNPHCFDADPDSVQNLNADPDKENFKNCVFDFFSHPGA
jgi:hypothetical protein